MSQTPPRIGFIGMGLMGIPMSQRILDAGFPLNIWNRTTEKCQSLPQANTMTSAGQLVHESDIICLCISDTDAVEALVFGESGIVAQLHSEQIVVDFSSIDPAATRRIAQRVHTESGAQWLDAPVSGGVAGATDGTLAIMVGGDSSVLEQVHPLLNLLSQRVTHMGPVGSGQTTKVCNQMLVSCNLLAMAEVLALAEQSGVDASRLPGALQGGFADSIPLQITGQRMANQDFNDVKWRVRTLLKDLDLATNLSDNNESRTPLTALTQSLLRRHAEAGYCDADPATLIKLYDHHDQ